MEKLVPQRKNYLRNPSKRDTLICCLLVFSFCYELPLIELTQYDRFNPRLVDIMTVIAVIFTRWKRNKHNKILRVWEYMTAFFVFSAFISFLLLLPRDYGYYSIFFAGKYIETLFGIWVLTGFNWQSHHIEKMFRFFCYGMIVAGIWGILQYLSILPKERYLPTGAQIITQENVIFATFGITYFHSGMMGAMGAGINIALLQRKAINKIIFGLSFSCCAFLALFSGSRAGLAALIIIVGIMVSRSFKSIAVAGIMALLLSIVGFYEFFQNNSLTAARLTGSPQHNTVENRIGADYIGLFKQISNYHGPKIFLFGGGFYAVPQETAKGIKYRVGYGFHNIHFFTLEQAGIGPFLLAFYFWYITIKHGYKQRKDSFGRCGLAIAATIALLGWTGQIFYHGFGTENMVTFQVFSLITLTSLIKNQTKRKIKLPLEQQV